MPSVSCKPAEFRRAAPLPPEPQRRLLEHVAARLWWADPAAPDIEGMTRWLDADAPNDHDRTARSWLDAAHPDDLAPARRDFAAAFAKGEPLERELRLRSRDGDYRWSLARQVPIRDETGAILSWVCVSIDIDELHGAQARRQAIMQELQHRTRNLLTVVLAVADKVLGRAQDLADFRARFAERIGALSRVQGLRAALPAGAPVLFEEVLRAEIAAVDDGGGRVTLAGPAGIALDAAAVEILTLALHELAANALKHGALAGPQGRLDVRWRIDAERGPAPWLRIDWREHGARPARKAAGAQSGFGRELIERVLPYQFGARTSYAFKADGVHCVVQAPLARTQASQNLSAPSAGA